MRFVFFWCSLFLCMTPLGQGGICLSKVHPNTLNQRASTRDAGVSSETHVLPARTTPSPSLRNARELIRTNSIWRTVDARFGACPLVDLIDFYRLESPTHQRIIRELVGQGEHPGLRMSSRTLSTLGDDVRFLITTVDLEKMDVMDKSLLPMNIQKLNIPHHYNSADMEALMNVLSKHRRPIALNFTNRDGNEMGNLGVWFVALILKKGGAIRALNLSNHGIGPEGVNSLMQVNFHGLEELSLGGNRLGDQGMQALTLMVQSPQANLTALELNNIAITPVGVATLARALEHNHQLEFLRLSQNPLGEKGGAALGCLLAVNDTLACLDISATNLRDAGFVAFLEGMRQNKALLVLNVNRNGIRGQVMGSVMDVLRTNRTLKTLYLDDNDIDPPYQVVVRDFVKAHVSLETVSFKKRIAL